MFITCPTRDSFEEYYSKGSRGKSLFWISKLVNRLINTTSIPLYDWIDYKLFIIVKIISSNQSNYFLGIFHSWIPIDKFFFSGDHARFPIPISNSNIISFSSLDNTDRQKSKAIKLKAEYNYSDAAEAFNNLADSLSINDSMEICDALENAAKCYKLSNQLDKAKNCWIRTGKIYSRTSRNVKYAQTLNHIFEITQDKTEKISLLREVIEQYELVNDNRVESVKETLAHLLSEVGQFDQSSELWEYLAIKASNDPIMIYRANNFILYALLAIIAHGLDFQSLQFKDSNNKEESGNNGKLKNNNKSEEREERAIQRIFNILNENLWIKRNGDASNLINVIINGLNGKISSQDTLEEIEKILAKMPSLPQWCTFVWKQSMEKIERRESDIT